MVLSVYIIIGSLSSPFFTDLMLTYFFGLLVVLCTLQKDHVNILSPNVKTTKDKQGSLARLMTSANLSGQLFQKTTCFSKSAATLGLSDAIKRASDPCLSFVYPMLRRYLILNVGCYRRGRCIFGPRDKVSKD